MADLTDVQSASPVKILGSDAAGVEQTPVQSTSSGAIHTNLRDSAGAESGTATNPLRFDPTGTTNQPAGVSIGNNWSPSTPYTQVSVGRLITDPDNQLIIRGDVLTDEGTFRDDFSGSNLSNQRWQSSSTGNSSISVSNSLVTLNSGTGTNNRVSIAAVGDYGPISFRSQLSISQRIANQAIQVGFADNTASPVIHSFFRFTGTDNTVVDCISSSSSAAIDNQTTTVKIPSGTSATSNDYYIEVQPDQVSFIINGVLVATHRLHIPGPYDVLNVSCFMQNTGAVTATSVAIDYIYFINQNSLQVNNSFSGDDIFVKERYGHVSTYGASVTGLTAANTATDIFTITGSANKTVKIRQLTLSATQTTAGNINLLLVKRSTANTGGTSVLQTAVPFDSLNPAATATVRSYTANPTLGTAVGTVNNEKLFIPTATGANAPFVFSPTASSQAQEITLRGTNEVLAVNLNGVTVGGNNFNIDITWTEE
jgi:hypothetical protein